MRTRPLGKTGLVVSELALGTWGLSGDGYGPVPEPEQDAMLERARAVGIDLFETADSYALGEMEKRLGQRLGDDPHVRFVTKLGTCRRSTPPRKRFDRGFLIDAFRRSRDRLARQVVDVVLLHNPSVAAVTRGEAVAALKELQKQGWLLAWGVSAGSADVANAALDAGAEVLQVAHNALYTQPLSGVAERLVNTGTGLLARSVLAHGLLCGHWRLDREFPVGDHRAERWTPQELQHRLRQLDALRPAMGGEVTTLRAVALRYVLANDSVSSAVVGPRRRLQLDQLVREAGREPPYLSEDQLQALAGRLHELNVARARRSA